jgi:hypothetical protein
VLLLLNFSFKFNTHDTLLVHCHAESVFSNHSNLAMPPGGAVSYGVCNASPVRDALATQSSQHHDVLGVR